MRSRRNLLDEIDASTLRLVRSRARVADARRLLLVRLGPPSASRAFGRRLATNFVTASAICPLTVGRDERRAQRSMDRSNVGLSQRTRGEPEWVSPREPSNNSIGPIHGQGRGRGARPRGTSVTDLRFLRSLT